MIRFPLTPEDYTRESVLGTKYFHGYSQPIAEILATFDSITSPKHQEDKTVFETDTGQRWVVDYGDQPMDVLHSGSTRGVFKMKYHLRAKDVYRTFDFPIVPGGFVSGPRRGQDAAADRRWLVENRHRLRALRKAPQRPVFSRGVFSQTMPVSAARMIFYDPRFDDGRAGYRMPFRQYLEEAASSRFVLNLCGNGDSIDRKVVEFCAMGAAIISSSGLRDLILPWGHRFVHGQNIWFLNEEDDIFDVMDSIPEAVQEELAQNSAALYDTALLPSSIGAWYQHTLDINTDERNGKDD